MTRSAALCKDREWSGYWQSHVPVFRRHPPWVQHRMAERSARQSQAIQAQQESYIKDVAGTNSPADQIAQAKKLLDSGAITQAEYESMKAKALS
jgi:Short C-terminal domain